MLLHVAFLHHREVSVLGEDLVKSRRVTGEALGKLQPAVDVLPLSVGVPLLCDGERIQPVAHGLHGQVVPPLEAHILQMGDGVDPLLEGDLPISSSHLVLIHLGCDLRDFWSFFLSSCHQVLMLDIHISHPLPLCIVFHLHAVN